MDRRNVRGRTHGPRAQIKPEKERSSGVEGRQDRVALHRVPPGNLVIGNRAAVETIRHAPERVERVLVTKGSRFLHGSGESGELPTLVSGYPCREVSDDELSRLAGSESHQGIGIVVKPRRHLSLKEAVALWRDAPAVLVLAVDAVVDPHNFGAILRAAECFGCAAVMVSENRGCSVTPTVTKTSAGASELIPILWVSNLAQGVSRLGEIGFWSIASALAPQAQPINKVSMPEKVVLIVGGEGAGVQPLLLRQADVVIKIPMYGQIQSLNVAQATAVLLSHYWRDRGNCAMDHGEMT